MRSTIRQKVIGLSALGIVFTLATGLAGYGVGWRSSDITANLLVQVEALSNHMRADMMRDALRADVLGALRAVESGSRTEHKAAQEGFKEHAAMLRGSVQANRNLSLGADVKSAYAKIQPQLAGYEKSAADIIQMAANDRDAANARFTEFLDNSTQLENEMRRLNGLIGLGVEEAEQATDATVPLALIAVVCMVAVIALAVISYLVTHSIANRLNRLRACLDDMNNGDGNLSQRLPVSGNDEISSVTASFNTVLGKLQGAAASIEASAKNVAAASNRVLEKLCEASAHSGEFSGRIAQMGAAMEKISVSVVEVAGNISAASEATAKTRSIAIEGRSNVDNSMEVTRRMARAVNASASSVGALSHTVEKIGAITDVIKEIAEQTNLLALNASIEAARAGEQGRGFAVVADEVRKLAERTALSTADISNMVQEIQRATKASVGSMQDAEADVAQGLKFVETTHKSLAEIVASANEVSAISQRIAAAATEQSSAIAESTQNMIKLSSLGEDSGAVIAQVNAISAEMSAASHGLLSLVNRFGAAR
ncbi:MAG: methyl-accepting chemotaxis protein [Burkholderiales bacterium]